MSATNKYTPEVGDFVLTIAASDLDDQCIEFSLVDHGSSIRVRRKETGDSWPLPGLSVSADIVAAVGNCRVTITTARFLLQYLRAGRKLYTLALRPAQAIQDGVDVFGKPHGVTAVITGGVSDAVAPASSADGAAPPGLSNASAVAPGSMSSLIGSLPVFGGLLFKITGEAKVTRKASLYRAQARGDAAPVPLSPALPSAGTPPPPRRPRLLSLLFGPAAKTGSWTAAFYVLDSEKRVMRRYRAEDAPVGSSLHAFCQPGGAVAAAAAAPAGTAVAITNRSVTPTSAAASSSATLAAAATAAASTAALSTATASAPAASIIIGSALSPTSSTSPSRLPLEVLPSVASRDVLSLDSVVGIDVLEWWDALPELPKYFSAAPASVSAASSASPTAAGGAAAAAAAAAVPTVSALALGRVTPPPLSATLQGQQQQQGGTGARAQLQRPQLLLLTCADGSSRHLLPPTLGATWTWMAALATATGCNVTPAAQALLEEAETRRARRLSRALSLSHMHLSPSSSSNSLSALLVAAVEGQDHDNVAAAAAAAGRLGGDADLPIVRSGSLNKNAMRAAASDALPLIVDLDSDRSEEEEGDEGDGEKGGEAGDSTAAVGADAEDAAAAAALARRNRRSAATAAAAARQSRLPKTASVSPASPPSAPSTATSASASGPPSPLLRSLGRAGGAGGVHPSLAVVARSAAASTLYAEAGGGSSGRMLLLQQQQQPNAAAPASAGVPAHSRGASAASSLLLAGSSLEASSPARGVAPSSHSSGVVDGPLADVHSLVAAAILHKERAAAASSSSQPLSVPTSLTRASVGVESQAASPVDSVSAALAAAAAVEAPAVPRNVSSSVSGSGSGSDSPNLSISAAAAVSGGGRRMALSSYLTLLDIIELDNISSSLPRRTTPANTPSPVFLAEATHGAVKPGPFVASMRAHALAPARTATTAAAVAVVAAVADTGNAAATPAPTAASDDEEEEEEEAENYEEEEEEDGDDADAGDDEDDAGSDIFHDADIMADDDRMADDIVINGSCSPSTHPHSSNKFSVPAVSSGNGIAPFDTASTVATSPNDGRSGAWSPPLFSSASDIVYERLSVYLAPSISGTRALYSSTTLASAGTRPSAPSAGGYYSGTIPLAASLSSSGGNAPVTLPLGDFGDVTLEERDMQLHPVAPSVQHGDDTATFPATAAATDAFAILCASFGGGTPPSELKINGVRGGDGGADPSVALSRQRCPCITVTSVCRADAGDAIYSRAAIDAAPRTSQARSARSRSPVNSSTAISGKGSGRPSASITSNSSDPTSAELMMDFRKKERLRYSDPAALAANGLAAAAPVVAHPAAALPAAAPAAELVEELLAAFNADLLPAVSRDGLLVDLNTGLPTTIPSPLLSRAHAAIEKLVHTDKGTTTARGGGGDATARAQTHRQAQLQQQQQQPFESRVSARVTALQAGDVLLSINNLPLTGSDFPVAVSQLSRIVLAHGSGAWLTLARPIGRLYA